MKRIRVILPTIALLTVIVVTATAQSADQIISRADETFTEERVYSTSTLTIYHGDRARPEQTMDSYAMDIDGQYHTLSVYREPARMRGTAYLMIEDDLWVRFGSTGRIRKLSSSAKKNSAGGSDFSYTDMGEGNQGIADRYNARLTGSADVDGRSCYVVELTAKPGEDAPYERIVAYISESDYLYRQIDYYDAGANIKSMYLTDYREVDGRNYPFVAEMRSNTSNSRTVIETTELEFDSPRVEPRLFSTAYLETIR